jgi:hypothetical protein
MKRILPILAGLALSACSSTAYQPLADYHAPAQCTPEALSQVTTSVIEVDKITYLQHGERVGAYGMWVEKPTGNVILILRGLPQPLRQEVLDHERCHELMFQLTGDGRWHG